MSSLRYLTLLSLFVAQQQEAFGFGGLDPALLHHSVTTAASSAVDSFLHITAAQHVTTAAASSRTVPGLDVLANGAQHVLGHYKDALAAHPLPTKMMTGATLATCGDAIAQSKDEDTPYDTRRAASFAIFDMAYRALQHASFPVIVEHCRGQVLTAGVTGMLGLVGLQHSASTIVGPEMTQNFAALEQTLASQLGVVPFLYYPVFFAMTGFIQGLTMEGSVDRAKEKFVPLMQRNLLFWIPVQFIQFGFIEESLQIPFLSVCGLAWTFILSIMAGDANSKATEAESSSDVVTVPAMEVVANTLQENDPIVVVSSEVLAAAVVEQEELSYANVDEEALAFEQQ